MMTVLEYAEDMQKTVADVLQKCKILGILAGSESDLLDDEAIVILDNSWDEDLKADESVIKEIEFEERVEELVEDHDFEKLQINKKEKIKPKDKKNIAQLKKEMYKNKTKLFANTTSLDNQVVWYQDNMTLDELAKELQISVVDLISKLMKLGNMATKNTAIAFEDAEILVSEYGKTLKHAKNNDVASFEHLEVEENEVDLVKRPAVVTIMGHVDHGKTTLLDTIRNSNVVSAEAGGITQHINAYQITYQGEKITFIDTPGHAAFTEMRARGANVTDIAIIIVAADDGVMPQTKEVIDHAKAAGVPIIVAINKIDKEGANPERIKQEMGEYGLMPEAWGGDTIYVEISAKKQIGIDELLDNVLLVAGMQELKANPNRYATGTVIESSKNKTTGNAITVLVQSGTLRLGDPIVIGNSAGKVRTMRNDLDEEIVQALPSSPVTITGVSETTNAGDKFMAFETDKEAKAIALKRTNETKKNQQVAIKKLNLEDLFKNAQNEHKKVNVIIKADVNGSEEAVKNALLSINVDGVALNVIRSGVGSITESDIVLANASDAAVIGFNIKTDPKISAYASDYGIEIKNYNIIYKLIEDIENSMKGMLDPVYEEKIIGEVSVKQIFTFSKVGSIAGSLVTSGIVKNNANVRVMRNNQEIIDTKVATLQREKDKVNEVKKGLECGITLVDFNDLQEGDALIIYEMVEVPR